MNTTVIGFGSNIDAEKNIRQAKARLAKDHRILSESNFITTKPIGYTDQPDFINGAVLMSTDLTIEQLKVYLRKVEIDQGRTKDGIKFGPRTIDLDILIWNNEVIDHDIYSRDFLQASIKELLPKFELKEG